MQVKDMNLLQKQPPNPPQRTLSKFSQPREPNIYFSSEFDSGNMHRVVRNSYDHYSIWTACDAQGTENEGYPKSWFYFQVGGFHNRRVIFSVHRVHFLWAMSKKQHLYRPVFRVTRYIDEGKQNTQTTEWARIPHPVISLGMNSDQQLVLKFDFPFTVNIKNVEFAFIYPYSHEQCRKDILNLKQLYQNDADICFRQYQFARTVQGRILDLVVISSHQGKQGFETLKTDQYFNLGGQKLIKFRNNKPIIFISARVHPIETPSSYCMNGIINFLLNKQDLRAHLLRKFFVFVLVPMLNPDGVSNGHCRMDSLNQNLNRYYKNPDPKKQPSCYAVKKLGQHYNKQKRIFMYLDLHAHPASKGNFIFGNAIFDYIQQVQSHLFPKIISQNCINFEFQTCNFSRKHMNAKDRNQDMNKQGCGRVVFYKDFGVGHAYTLQCGYHLNNFDNVLTGAKDKNNDYKVKFKLNQKGQKIYQLNEKSYPSKHNCQQKSIQKLMKKQSEHFEVFSYTEDPLQDINSQYYRRDIVFFTQQTFHNLGKGILVSILDIWNRNPYSRVVQINQSRKQIAQKHSKLDRFRKEQAGIKGKQKRIVQLIEQQFYGTWIKRNVLIGKKEEQSDNRKKSQFQLARSSHKVRRNQKILTIQSTKVIGNTLVQQKQIQTNKQITIKEVQAAKQFNEITKQIQPVSTNIVPISNQIGKLNDSKNIFRPVMNMRIRTVNQGNSSK